MLSQKQNKKWWGCSLLVEKLPSLCKVLVQSQPHKKWLYICHLIPLWEKREINGGYNKCIYRNVAMKPLCNYHILIEMFKTRILVFQIGLWPRWEYSKLLSLHDFWVIIFINPFQVTRIVLNSFYALSYSNPIIRVLTSSPFYRWKNVN
jgi:hypothetical protein